MRGRGPFAPPGHPRGSEAALSSWAVLRDLGGMGVVRAGLDDPELW
jgi:hypothetical protein